MHLKELATFLLSATPLVLAGPIALRDDSRRDEAVFLTKCDLYVKGNDATPNGQKDKLFYFKDYNKSLNPTSSFQNDEDYSNNPGDKNHPVDWTSGTLENPIKGRLDGRTFMAWDLKEQAPDVRTHATGLASLGGSQMKCYDNANATWKQDYGEKMYVKCRAKYFCTREERQIRRVLFNIYNTTEKVVFEGHASDPNNDREVSNMIRGAFSSLQTHYLNGEINRDTFKIGNSEHLMEYYVHRQEKPGDPFWEADRIQLIQEHLLNYVVPAIKKTEKIDWIRHFGGDKVTFARHTFSFPNHINIQVQVADQFELDWEDRDVVELAVKKVSGSSCELNKALSGSITGVFAMMAKVATGGLGVGLAGLGVVVSKSVDALC